MIVQEQLIFTVEINSVTKLRFSTQDRFHFKYFHNLMVDRVASSCSFSCLLLNRCDLVMIISDPMFPSVSEPMSSALKGVIKGLPEGTAKGGTEVAGEDST